MVTHQKWHNFFCVLDKLCTDKQDEAIYALVTSMYILKSFESPFLIILPVSY